MAPRRKPSSARPPLELEETRAVKALKLLLAGWEGAILSHDSQIDSDYRARIRTASARIRRAFETGTTAHAALLELG